MQLVTPIHLLRTQPSPLHCLSFLPHKVVYIPTIASFTYLIFVISFTQAGFLNPKFLHPKSTQNTQKL